MFSPHAQNEFALFSHFSSSFLNSDIWIALFFLPPFPTYFHLISVLYPSSLKLIKSICFGEDIQIHDDVGGHEIGEKHDTEGNVGDEDMVSHGI